MQVPDQNCVTELRSARLTKTLHKIQDTLRIPSEMYCDVLGVPPEEINPQNIPMSGLDRLAHALRLDVENLLNGEIDYQTLYQHHYHGKKAALPEKYTCNLSSRMRTAQNIIDYLELYSPFHAQLITKKLQINPSTFYDLEKKISVALVNDLYKQMAYFNFTGHDFYKAGYLGALKFKNSPAFYQKFKAVRTPHELYELFFGQQVKYLEQNWDYKIVKVSKNKCTFRVTTRPEISDIFHTTHFGTPGFCSHKAGFGAGLLEYLQISALRVQETKCFHRNDPYCEFEIEWADYKSKPRSEVAYSN